MPEWTVVWNGARGHLLTGLWEPLLDNANDRVPVRPPNQFERRSAAACTRTQTPRYWALVKALARELQEQETP